MNEEQLTKPTESAGAAQSEAPQTQPAAPEPQAEAPADPDEAILAEIGAKLGLDREATIAHLKHRPWPRWVVLAAAGLAVLVVVALAMSPRYFAAAAARERTYAALRDGDIAAALAFISQADRSVPHTRQIRGLMGQVLMAAGRESEGEAAIREVVSKDDVGAWVSEGQRLEKIVLGNLLFHQAGQAFQENRYDDAIAKLQEMIASQGDAPNLESSIGWCYLSKAEEGGGPKAVAAAREAFNKALALDPKSQNAQDGLAELDKLTSQGGSK